MTTRKYKISNRILSLVLAFVMVLGMMPMTTYAATTEAVNLDKEIEYITYSSGAAQYFSYENYLYKVTYTNIKVNQIGIGIYGKYLVFFSPAISGNYSSLMSDKGINLKPEELPKNKNSSLVAYSLSTSISTSVGRMVKVATITLVEVDEPTWTWNDTSSATATFTAKGADVFTTADATISSEVLSTATDCKTKEQVKYTASVTFNGQTYTDTKVEEGEEVGLHSYTYSASGNIISESCNNGCGHSATATLLLDPSASLSYTGSEIKPLKVEYSDGWKGETLAVSYQNNITVSTDSNKASGSITKDGVSATQNFTITKATMSGITVDGYSGKYDGNAHSISITGVPEGATIGYRTSENESYTAVNPSYKEIGTYTVYYKIEKENYETITGSETVVISQATNTWTIAPSIDGWTYGQTANTPSASAKHGEVKVEYRLASKTDADYTTTVPTDAGSYLVRFSVEGTENYTSLLEVVNLEIAKVKLTITADDKNTVYGESNPALTWQITEGTMVGSDALQNISISRVEGKDADSYTITVSQTDGSNHNYDITFKNGTFTIKQKEIGISWGATEFMPYTGELIVPQATATGLEAGDECILTTEVVETADGAGIIPGTWTAKVTALSNDNYKLPESGVRVEATFEIVNASQNYAPDGVSGVNETIDGKADGKITGVDSTMEYRKDGETEYTAINGTEVADLADGTYYVRYAAKTYYNASPDKEVVIGAGRKLTVTVPTVQTGYTITAEDTELVWNDSTTITFALANGYSATDAFAVKVNGNKVELNADNQYVITNAQENITVTVEGVADTTAPTAEITLGTNKWNTFLNNITFGLFFKETQNVTIIAEDANTGSGLDKVYYYLASEELTEDEVKAFADWKEYDGAFSINPNNEYIIYAKAVDKAGNASYISSDGIVLDAIAPVIIGVENDGTYYGNTQFSVDESYIDTVIVDENNVNLTDGKYTITADGKEHTIVVTDKAGNSSTVKVTVITIASLDDTIENIKTTDVKSTDKEDIQEVLDFVNSLIDSGKDFTDEEDEQLSEIKSNAESLLKQIDDTKAETKDLTDKVNAYEEAKVTSDDKQTLTDLVTDIDELLEGDNLTEEEKEPLEEVKETAEALIKKIDDIAAETKDLTDKVDAYEETKVTSDDKQTIEDLIADIDELLEGDNLTEEEKEALGDVKDDAEALIKKIDDAAKADDTDNTEKVKDITSDNVTTDDKADLEKAKDDLEKALEDYKDNLTEDEKKAIEDEIDRIDDALEIIEKVEAVEDKINKLPDTITKNDADAIKAAEDAYNALSKYEQSIVDKDIKKKLDNAIAALENLNKPVTSPDTGDNTNIWMWFAVLFVSGMGLFGTIVYDRKKKQAK